MIKPLVEDRTATDPEFETLYIEYDFDSLLPLCETYTIEERYYPNGHPGRTDTIHKYGKKYRKDGVTVAVIFYYTHASRTVSRHFRMLRCGDIRYSAPLMPPIHPQKV